MNMMDVATISQVGGASKGTLIKYRNFILEGKVCYEHHLKYKEYLKKRKASSRENNLDHFETIESAMKE